MDDREENRSGLDTDILMALLENTPGGILVEDQNRRIRLVNEEFLRMFEIPAAPPALVGMDCSDSARQSAGIFKDPDTFMERIEAILERREKTLGDLLELEDGRYFERDYVPVFTGDVYAGHYWAYRDVTEREQARLRIARMALTDELTGLYNRRGFMARALQLRDLAVRGHVPVALIYFDLNNMKLLNDNFGHEAGDRALELVAKAMRKSCRTVDVTGRLGGDEFAAFLYDADLTAARLVLDRVRDTIAKNCEDCKWVASISAGIAVERPATPGNQALQDLIVRADRAMYTNKISMRPES